MKTTTETNKHFKTTDIIKYPCLMQGSLVWGGEKQIILATSFNGISYTGFNVNGVGYSLGHFSSDFDDNFTLYYGSVTITTERD